MRIRRLLTLRRRRCGCHLGAVVRIDDELRLVGSQSVVVTGTDGLERHRGSFECALNEEACPILLGCRHGKTMIFAEKTSRGALLSDIADQARRAGGIYLLD